MGSGYVLDFTNHSFQEAMKDFCDVDIYSDHYADLGDSKGKRLRCFFSKSSKEQLARVIQGLLDYAQTFIESRDVSKEPSIEKIINRLGGKPVADEETQENFLDKEFPKVDLSPLPIESSFIDIMQARWQEVASCERSGAYLSAVIMTGSLLEAILLGVASSNPREFNQSKSSPKDENGNPKKFPQWNLASLIEVAYETNWIDLDVKKHSHALRDFRNYIHPYQQKASGFHPTKETVAITMQVFRAAVAQIKRNF